MRALDSWQPLHAAPEMMSTSMEGSYRLLNIRDLYWRSPESGGVWYKSRRLKRWFDPAATLRGARDDERFTGGGRQEIRARSRSLVRHTPLRILVYLVIYDSG